MPFRDSPARRSLRDRIRIALAKVQPLRTRPRRGPGSPPNADPLPCPTEPKPGGLSGGAAALIGTE